MYNSFWMATADTSKVYQAMSKTGHPVASSIRYFIEIRLTLPDLSLFLPTTLFNGEGGGSVDIRPILTHKPFALTTSNLVGC